MCLNVVFVNVITLNPHYCETVWLNRIFGNKKINKSLLCFRNCFFRYQWYNEFRVTQRTGRGHRVVLPTYWRDKQQLLNQYFLRKSFILLTVYLFCKILSHHLQTMEQPYYAFTYAFNNDCLRVRILIRFFCFNWTNFLSMIHHLRQYFYISLSFTLSSPSLDCRLCTCP